VAWVDHLYHLLYELPLSAVLLQRQLHDPVSSCNSRTLPRSAEAPRDTIQGSCRQLVSVEDDAGMYQSKSTQEEMMYILHTKAEGLRTLITRERERQLSRRNVRRCLMYVYKYSVLGLVLLSLMHVSSQLATRLIHLTTCAGTRTDSESMMM